MLPSRIVVALRRSRGGILSISVTYLGSLLLGIAIVGLGNDVALAQRDRMVQGAQRSPTLAAYQRGARVEAALLDFGSNLVIGAAPTTITGILIVGPYPVVAYRGWVGGIVSVNSQHRSRLSTIASARFYLGALILQLIPYCLTGGAGVQLGIASWRRRSDPSLKSWFGFRLPPEAVADVGYIYLLAGPLFLLASLWEFLT